MSDSYSLGMMIGNENIDHIKRELAKTIEGSFNHYDAVFLQLNCHTRRKNSSQENGPR